ncbi:hypothetical protein LG293_17045 (plasmid) [Citricoccus nitrophenolicus]
MSTTSRLNPTIFHLRPEPVEAMQVARPYKAVADWSGATIIRGTGNSVAWLQLEPDDVLARAYPGNWIIKRPDGTLEVLTDYGFQARYAPGDQLAGLEQAVAKVRHEAIQLTELDDDHFYMTATSPAEVGRELLALLPEG